MNLDLIKTFLTAKALWIKIVVVVIMAIYVMAYVYNAGKQSERSEWLDKEQEFLAQQSD